MGTWKNVDTVPDLPIAGARLEKRVCFVGLTEAIHQGWSLFRGGSRMGIKCLF